MQACCRTAVLGVALALSAACAQAQAAGRKLFTSVTPAGAQCHTLKDAGATRLALVCLVVAPEGVEAVSKVHPDVLIWTAAIDRELDDNAYIRPGLGDAGDRVFGT